MDGNLAQKTNRNRRSLIVFSGFQRSSEVQFRRLSWILWLLCFWGGRFSVHGMLLFVMGGCVLGVNWNLRICYVPMWLCTYLLPMYEYLPLMPIILPISRSHFANKTSFFGTLGSTRAQGSRYNVAVLRRILEKNSLMFFFFFFLNISSNNNEKSILYLSATTHFIWPQTFGTFVELKLMRPNPNMKP